MIRFDDKVWRLALIDLDGTLYAGTRVIDGAPAFVERLRKRGIGPVFFTNNSSRTPSMVAAKLQQMGISAGREEVVTSAQMTAWLAAKRLPRSAHVAYIGGEGLGEALAEAALCPVNVQSASRSQLEACEGAVLGINQTATYIDLAHLCGVVERLGWFILTNADVRLPSEAGFLPGNGALGSFVATATDVKPIVAGKPSADYVAYALRRFGVERQYAVIIGDNLKTDILAGQAAGIDSILVQSGVAYVGQSEPQVKPTYIAGSVADLF